MTKQRYDSFLSRAFAATKVLSTKLITTYLGLCCGLMLLGGVFTILGSINTFAKTCGTYDFSKNQITDVVPSCNIPICTNTWGVIQNGTKGFISCGTSAEFQTATTDAATQCYNSQNIKVSCITLKEDTAGNLPPATTIGGNENLGGTKKDPAKPTDPKAATPATATEPELTKAPGTSQDPCEGRYGGQVRFRGENFDCSKNPQPAFKDGGDDLAINQASTREYINQMCARVDGTESFSSPSHNQKWTCTDGKLSGNITNIMNATAEKPIKRTQVDVWLKKAAKAEEVKLPVDGAEFLGRNLGCGINKTTIRLIDLPDITNFVPIIPVNCTTTSDGLAIPLSPMLAVQVIVRLFGFLASFVFYLINFVLMYNGLMWIYGGIDGKSQATAKRNIGDLTWGLVLLLGAYVIISTIVGLIGAGAVETDLSTFFNNNTKI